jgi:FKBP-type peptidyl-prolyl cis-trans isomerase 2
MIEDGKKVSLEYTLKLDDGKVADTNVGGEALTYEQGGKQILPALENALLGLEAGDTKNVTLQPEDGYGTVDANLFETVPIAAIPEEAREAGAQLLAKAPNGQARPVRVHEVRDADIVIDLNHPLAGETLHFEVKVLEVI